MSLSTPTVAAPRTNLAEQVYAQLKAELAPALAPVRQRLEELEIENARLRAELAASASA